MKTTFTREEVSKLLRLLEWTDIATISGDQEKNQIKEIAMKLRVALKNNPDDLNFEFLVEQ